MNRRLSLIAAVAKNRAIGKDGQLLWHLPDDMRYFRETTRGKPVIMGRKTWESLPAKFRPLPGRQNSVVSRNPDFSAPGASLFSSVEDALNALSALDTASEVFVIGGAALYSEMLPHAERLYLTEIDADFDGDVFFPEFPRADWRELSRHKGPEQNGLHYSYAIYARV